MDVKKILKNCEHFGFDLAKTEDSEDGSFMEFFMDLGIDYQDRELELKGIVSCDTELIDESYSDKYGLVEQYGIDVAMEKITIEIIFVVDNRPVDTMKLTDLSPVLREAIYKELTNKISKCPSAFARQRRVKWFGM
jgi:hypothetical protein